MREEYNEERGGSLGLRKNVTGLGEVHVNHPRVMVSKFLEPSRSSGRNPPGGKVVPIVMAMKQKGL